MTWEMESIGDFTIKLVYYFPFVYHMLKGNLLLTQVLSYLPLVPLVSLKKAFMFFQNAYS